MPNREKAVIEQSKITQYLLNVERQRGGVQARLLIQFGDIADNWQQLEAKIRQYHLEADVETIKETLLQIDDRTDFPRLITLVPD